MRRRTTIDATTGNHLWAERYDKPVADFFDMQDEIVANLANRLRTELIATEGRRAEVANQQISIISTTCDVRTLRYVLVAT